MAEERNRTIEVVGVGAVAIADLPRRGPLLVDGLLEHAAEEMVDVTRRAAQGEMTVAAWETEMQALIKQAHNAAEMLGRGGRPLGLVERALAWFRRRQEISEQFRFLGRLANEIRAGQFDPERLLPGLESRVRQYANAARAVYEDTRLREAVRGGATEKRRVLEPGADHCEDCLRQAALGWVGINDPRITRIGETECQSNDQCTIETR